MTIQLFWPENPIFFVRIILSKLTDTRGQLNLILDHENLGSLYAYDN